MPEFSVPLTREEWFMILDALDFMAGGDNGESDRLIAKIVRQAPQLDEEGFDLTD